MLVSLAEGCSRHPNYLAAAAERLRWWANYAELYRRTRVDERRLLKDLRANASVAITSCLSAAEYAFVNGRPAEGSALKRDFNDLSPEEIATGASYALEAFARFAPLSKTNAGPFTKRVPSSRFMSTLFLAYQLREILDMEADVFRAGFHCLKTEGSGPRPVFEISPPDERFGQAMSYGYLLSDAMQSKNQARLGTPTANSLRTLVEGWIRNLNNRLAAFEGKGCERRLVMKLPTPLLRKLGEDFVVPDTLFAEEVVEIQVVAMELMWPTTRLLEFELEDGLRVFDVLKIHRVLRIVAASRLACLNEAGVTPLEYWNSIVAAMTRDDLRRALEAFGISAAAATKWLGFFVWKTEAPSFLDLQYKPAVEVGGAVSVLAAVASSSNFARNALVVSKRRPWAKTDVEMIEKLCSAFDGHPSASVWPTVTYGAGATKGEVDCLVFMDSTLFALECKMALLPCSGFERRTTVDCLRDASDQLARFRAYWQVPENRRALAANRSCGSLEYGQLRCGIVLGHRLLSGAQWNGWPIRQIRELWNFVRTGEGEVDLHTAKVPIRMRGAGPCSATDLVQYLSPDALHQAPVWLSVLTSIDPSA